MSCEKRYWYVLTPTTADPYDPTSYARIDTSPRCQVQGCIICAIYACAGNVFPSPEQFTVGHNMYNYITAAITPPCNPQPEGAGQKIYVYNRPVE